ncbi:MAG: TetR/AcrR family transcriptional regulator [Pyrinomonadaceae bacterium]
MKDTDQPKTTRDAILDATDLLLERSGYKKMTIDDLAREVGIGKGSVYLHFPSKEEIALSHIDRIIDRLKDKLHKVGGESLAPPEKLAKMLTTRVLFRFDSIQHYSQSLNELLGYLRPQLLDRRRKYFEEEAKILARVIADGQTAHVFVDGDPLDIARTFITATNSLLPYSLSAFELGDRKVLQKTTKKLADILIRGLRA